MKTRVLVVGAKGFLGTQLTEAESRIIEFIPLPANDWSLPEPDSRIDSVVFLRSISSPSYVEKRPNESQRLNVEQTTDYIDKCLGLGRRVIFTSSDVVYGDTGDTIVNEQASTSPHGLYANQKCKVEKHFSDSKLFISLRLSLITGAGSKLRNILSKEVNPKIADPFVRSPINVRHVVDLIQTLSSEQAWLPENRVLNVGGREHITIFDLARIEARLYNLSSPIKTPPTELDLIARPQTVRMNSGLAEGLVGGTKFGFD